MTVKTYLFSLPERLVRSAVGLGAGLFREVGDVAVVQPIDTNEKYAFAFAPTNTALVTAWNDGLQQVIDDGEYATIFATYFPGTPVPDAYQPAGASGSASAAAS